MSVAAHLATVRTVLAPSAVKAIVEQKFELGDVTMCALHSVTIHDHYFVEAGGKRFMFRVYNAEHSATPDDPGGLFELELLAYLSQKGEPVSGPVALADGSKFGRLEAGEGSRRYALFDFAEGRPIFPPSPAQARVLGARIAELHLAMSGFSGGQPSDAAQHLELDQVLHDSVHSIEAAIGDRRPEDTVFMRALAADLERAIQTFVANQPREGEAYGPVGEHFTGTNNHWADDQTPIFFSFSGCGRGWRAFDVACFLWQTLLWGMPAEIWAAYLEGYESVRALSAAEQAVLPALAKLKMIQIIGFHTSLTKWMGSAFQDGAYWDRHFGPLRRWHEELMLNPGRARVLATTEVVDTLH
jgi:Ser/Thr protein kinase RdoA (MazF antagonist)